jgi:hypothetical protein
MPSVVITAEALMTEAMFVCSCCWYFDLSPKSSFKAITTISCRSSSLTVLAWQSCPVGSSLLRKHQTDGFAATVVPVNSAEHFTAFATNDYLCKSVVAAVTALFFCHWRWF